MHDVIIVGAGIAGSVLAERLKRLDKELDVLVIEKSRGFKHDSGIVAAGHVGKTIPKNLIKDKIDKMALVSPCGHVIDINTEKPFAFLVKREELEKYLRSRINDRIVYDCVKVIIWEEDFAQVVGENDIYYAKMVVGCDGACSIVRKFMRLYDGVKKWNASHSTNIVDKAYILSTIKKEDSSMIFGVIGNHKIEQDNIHVYFNKLFSKDFFAWTIPQNNEYGLMTATDPLSFCKCFGRKMGFGNIITEQRSCETIGKPAISITPMTIGMKKSYCDSALLVGESAGQVKPITGGGIDMAISNSFHATNVIRKAIKTDNTDSDFLKTYEDLWKSEFGKEIGRQIWLRKIYSRLNNQQIDELFRIARSVKIDEIEDYVGLSGLMRKMPKLRLFLWGLRNFGVFRA